MRKFLILLAFASVLFVSGCTGGGASVTEVDNDDRSVVVDEMDDDVNLASEVDNADEGYDSSNPTQLDSLTDDESDAFDDVEMDDEEEGDDDAEDDDGA